MAELRVPEWMQPHGIKEGQYLTISKAQLQAKQRPCYPLKTQVWATGILHTAGYQGELAVTLQNGKRRPLVANDIIAELHKATARYYEAVAIDPSKLASLRQTKEHIRRVIEELEDEGLAERKSKGQPLSKMTAAQLRKLNGKIEIHFYLTPRPAKPETVRQEWEEAIRCPPDEVAEKRLLPLSTPFILRAFQMTPPEKAVLKSPEYQQHITRAYESARKVFVEVAQNWLLPVAAPGPPEVAATGGALERIVETPVEKSDSPATTTKQQAPTVETGGLVVVAERLRQYGNITDTAVAQFLEICNTATPGCKVETILQAIDQIGSTIRPNVGNPIGLLIRAVPGYKPAAQKTPARAEDPVVKKMRENAERSKQWNSDSKSQVA